jgi:hypothetical protein
LRRGTVDSGVGFPRRTCGEGIAPGEGTRFAVSSDHLNESGRADRADNVICGVIDRGPGAPAYELQAKRVLLRRTDPGGELVEVCRFKGRPPSRRREDECVSAAAEGESIVAAGRTSGIDLAAVEREGKQGPGGWSEGDRVEWDDCGVSRPGRSDGATGRVLIVDGDEAVQFCYRGGDTKNARNAVNDVLAVSRDETAKATGAVGHR